MKRNFKLEKSKNDLKKHLSTKVHLNVQKCSSACGYDDGMKGISLTQMIFQRGQNSKWAFDGKPLLPK